MSSEKTREWSSYLASIREDQIDDQLVKKTQAFFNSDRYAHTKRHYTAQDVASLKSSLDLVTPAHYMSQKLYSGFRKAFEKG
jgi:isocitrate lyase